MEYIIDIKGMHCNSCVKLIESKISSLKGVDKIRVSLTENKAFVQFNPEVISLEKIKSEIQGLGYSINVNIETKPSDNSTISNDKAIENSPIINNKKNRNILQGIAYGLIPHIGCIAFIIGSIFGVTFLMEYFKPLLMNPYFFHILVLISLGFATLSSILYLRKNGLLSSAGMKRKWKYLTTMYGSTIGINLLLFLVIFPLLANVSVAQPTSQSITGALVGVSGTPNNDGLSSLRLSVDIPCSGHAPLISQELKKIDGVMSIQFGFPNIFDVKYDSTKTSKQQILSLDVFKTYKATVLSEASNQNYADDNGSIEKSSGNISAVTNGIQTVQLSVQGSNYYPYPIRVKKGVPVQLVADMNNMPGCSRSIVIPEFGVRKIVSADDNVIEFTPDKSGTFKFSCSMGMYLGQMVVEEADGSVSAYTGSASVPSGGSCGGSGGGCSCGSR